MLIGIKMPRAMLPYGHQTRFARQRDKSALDCEATHVQRQADEAARLVADNRRRELAAKKKSTFVATAFREPGPKKAAHAARKLGKKKSVESGKQGKKGMLEKYKFKNKNFK